MVQFQSTLPVGGATRSLRRYCGSVLNFNPRSPWGERPTQAYRVTGLHNFNPRSPWGERPVIAARAAFPRSFQSTLPVGGATATGYPVAYSHFISIHAPRGGSDTTFPTSITAPVPISIHAPRGGSDVSGPTFSTGATNFNPRSPWGERRCRCIWRSAPLEFQSTLPVGGATELLSLTVPTVHISIHAPRGGSD